MFSRQLKKRPTLSSRAKRGICFFLRVLAFSTLLSALAAAQEPGRPSISGIMQVELYSTNLEATGGFFSTVFGSSGAPTASDDCQWSNVSQVMGQFHFHSFCSGQHL